MANLVEILARARLLPAAVDSLGPFGAMHDGVDLLPALIEAWRRAGDGKQFEVWQQCRRRAAELTLVEAGGRLETRLAWWPWGRPNRHRVGLISSRLGRKLDEHKNWFKLLRAACLSLNPRTEMLVASPTTAAGKFVQRAGTLFGLPVLRIECGPDDASIEQWGDKLLQSLEQEPPKPWIVWLSPPLAPVPAASFPPADRAVAAFSDRLIALRIRPGGNQHGLLQKLLEIPQPRFRIYLALGEDLTPKQIAEPLMDRGAVGWLVLDSLKQPHETPPPWVPAASRGRAGKIVPLPRAEDWAYLTHCTRRRRGPWPDETESHYLDDLILDREGADHSALAALWRIVHGRRLLASSEMIRGDCRCVCFTRVPLVELPQLRQYRSHVSRWDFEPYGICIRREWLEQRGARPVIYGDEALWNSLPAGDRPFFQRADSTTATGKKIDWTAEREWRIIGDVSLDRIPAGDALLFVPSEAQARCLAAHSPWPVTVLSVET